MFVCKVCSYQAIFFFFFNCQSKSCFLNWRKLQMWDLKEKKTKNSCFYVSTTHLWDFNRRVAVDEAAAEIHLWAGKPGLPVVHLHSLPIYSWAGDTSEFKQRCDAANKDAGGRGGGSAQRHKTVVELIKCAELSKVIDLSGVRGELGSKLSD